jgi:large subunit ribosomal protein L9
MKVLLRRNVSNLGIIGEVVDVKPGYARNYLVPQGLAIQPTEGNLKRVEAEKAAYLAELAEQRKELEAQAKLVDGKEVTIQARANEEGHLYGSVGPAQITAALAEQNVFVEQNHIKLDEPIRQLDKYEVTVDFGEEVTATVTVWVVPIRSEAVEDLPPYEPPAGQEEDQAAPVSETAEETSEAPEAPEGTEE